MRFAISAAIIAGAVLLAILLVSLAPEPERQAPPSTDPFVTTTPAVAGSGGITVHGAGTVRATAKVGVAAEVGGRVVWVSPAFERGGRVEADAVLFRIERESHTHRLREAEAMLADRQIAVLEAEQAAAVARADYAHWSGRVSNANGGDVGGPTASASQPSPLVLREPQLNAARAALARDEARVAEARLALSRTEVRAPFRGRVTAESVAVGQFLAPGQVVGELIAADVAQVAVPLADRDAALIPNLWDLRAGDDDRRVGARVIADYGGARYAWEGYVDRADASLDEESRTTDAIVLVPEPYAPGTAVDATATPGSAPPLPVGKFVAVELQGSAPGTWYRVPRAALQTGDEVWAVGDDGTLRIVPVRVIQRHDDEAWVSGALRDGQAVVTGGIAFATEGMRVRIGASDAR